MTDQPGALVERNGRIMAARVECDVCQEGSILKGGLADVGEDGRVTCPGCCRRQGVKLVPPGSTEKVR